MKYLTKLKSFTNSKANIKTFEQRQLKRQRWFIPYNNKNLIKLALNKIQIITPTIIEEVLKELSFHTNYSGFSIVIPGYFQNDYSMSIYKNFKDFEKNKKEDENGLCEYKGMVKLEDWEINADKYNL